MQIPIQTYISYSDISKKAPIQTLKRYLRQFDQQSLVIMLAKINNLIFHDKVYEKDRNRPDLQDILIDQFIPKDIATNPEFLRLRSEGRVVFLRQQILSLLRLCSFERSQLSTLVITGKESSGYLLGQCCLIMNDHLEPAKQRKDITTGTSSKKRKHLGIQMGATFELNNPPNIERAMVRSEIMFSDNLHSQAMRNKIAKELKRFDLEAEFSAKRQLTIEEYRDFVFMVLFWYLGHDFDDFLSGRAQFTLNRFNYMSQTLVKQEDFDNYLELDCLKFSDLSAKVKESRPSLAHLDFVVFRERPLVELDNDALVCLDPSLLLEKLSSGLYWSILNSSPPRGLLRDQSFQSFGYLFELYVKQIMEELYPTRAGLFTFSPTFENGEEAFDGIIWLGDHLILLEFKARLLTLAAKYSGKIKTFYKDFDKKFISGKNAGVVQLLNNIERLFNSDKEKRENLIELPGIQQRVSKISPVIITLEPFLRFDFMNWWLNKEFVRRRRGRKITRAISLSPLQVIDIDTLERLRANILVGDFTLEQCLNRRAFDDPTQLSSFDTFMRLNYEKYGKRKDSSIEERFDLIFKRIKKKFFNK